MKKTYINPSLEVINVNAKCQLLNGSGVKTGGAVGQEYSSTDVNYGRSDDFDWDD